MKIRIEPYKTWSGGARALGKRAGILRATHKQVKKHGDFSHIINWGRNEKRFQGTYLNEPQAVIRATNKKTSMEILGKAGVPQPDFTTEKATAVDWWNDNCVVVARKLLRANSGRGIVICSKEDNVPVPSAPLYTMYAKKADEYRIHVFDGQVIDYQQKKRKLEVPDEEVNYQIRNTAGGWIFARMGVEPPKCVLEAAIQSVKSLGLDFGAVDVGYNRYKDTAYVFEVNTAPGLEGSTLDAYYGALLRKFPSLKSGMYRKRRS